VNFKKLDPEFISFFRSIFTTRHEQSTHSIEKQAVALWRFGHDFLRLRRPGAEELGGLA